MIATVRRTVQGLTLALLLCIPFLNKNGITFISGSLYSLAVGPVWITDPLIGLQTVLTTRAADGALLLSVLIPVFTALALGRVFCGWVCPQNTISEIADAVAARFGIRRRLSMDTGAAPRYNILGLILLLTALSGIPLASLLSAPGIISVQIAQAVSLGTAGLELALVGLIVFGELFLLRRAWCNTICPMGSFLGLFRFRKTLKVELAEDGDRICGNCLACADACGLGLDPLRKNRLYPQCHNCGACIAACKRTRADKRPLRFRF